VYPEDDLEVLSPPDLVPSGQDFDCGIFEDLKGDGAHCSLSFLIVVGYNVSVILITLVPI
jgi:hypothetical protein